MIDEILEQVRRIAVLGFTDRPERAGHYVPAYLADQGYTVVGVNPRLAGCPGVVGRLEEVEPAPDLVLVFRKSEEVPGHLPELLGVRPRYVWLQSGIRHDPTARALEQAGIGVVQDRCMLVEHRQRST